MKLSIAELLLEQPVLFLQIVDHLLLLAVEPEGKGGDHVLKREKQVDMRISIPIWQPESINNGRPGFWIGRHLTALRHRRRSVGFLDTTAWTAQVAQYSRRTLRQQINDRLGDGLIGGILVKRKSR